MSAVDYLFWFSVGGTGTIIALLLFLWVASLILDKLRNWLYRST